MEDILILLTGGTIGSEWSPAHDTTIVKEENTIESYIKDFINPDFDVSYNVIAMKDSREINDAIRNKILDTINKTNIENIIITHGTYTMTETGCYLKKYLQNTNKKVILTGSFWPLKGFAPNDAAFNLGFAFGSFANLKPGVYVSMHAKLFNPDEIIKDVGKAHFTYK